MSSNAMVAPAPSRVASDMAAGGVPARSWRSFALALLLLVLIASGIGAAVHVSAKRSVVRSVHDNLEAIVRLRASHVEDWLGGVHRDAGLALDVPWFAEELGLWLAEGAPVSARRARLLAHLEATASAGRFRDLSIRSPDDGGVLLSTDPVQADTSAARALALKAMAERRPVLDDLHAVDVGRSEPGLGLCVYHAVFPAGKVGPSYVVQVALDPAVALLPLLNQWPGRSASAEMLLFRVDGEEIVYLNHSRHEPQAALVFRRPLKAADLAAKAAGGALGPLTGVDYRGVSSLGFAMAVAGTPWFLMAKVDADEAFADLARVARVAIAAALCMILLFAWWQTERSRRRDTEYRALFDRSLLTRRIEFLARYANDGILLADTDGRIIEVNSLCAAIYGYQREEMFGMRVGDVWAERRGDGALDTGNTVMREADTVYEAEHRRKDGSPVAVEVSSRMIEIDGRRYFQAIIRDNGQRKQYEMSLRQSEERFRLTFDYAPIGMLMVGLDSRILAVNAACCRLVGYSQAELLSMTISDTTHPEERAREAHWLDDLRRSETSNRTIEKRIVRKDHRIIHVSVTRSLVRDINGDPLHAVAQVRDITEQRESAARIERLSQLKAALSEVNHAILHSRSVEEVYGAVCRSCVDRGGFRLAWVGIIDPALEQVVPAAVYGPAAAYLDGVVVSSRADVPPGQCPSAMVALGSGHYLCNDFFMDPVYAPWRDRAYRHGLAASICVELRRGGEAYGALSAYGAERNSFDDEAVDMLRAMAENISFAIDRFDREAQRLQAEAELRRSERKAHHYALEVEDLYQHAPCGYHSVNAEGLICRMNDTELGWLGYAREELVGRMRLRDLIAEGSRQDFDDHFDAFKRDGQLRDLELTMQRKDGTSFPVLVSATAIYDSDGRFVASRSTVHDITRIKVLEAERARQAEHLQRMSHHLVAVQEEERRRLASELHDRASPNLAAIKLTLDTLTASLPASLPAAADACVDDARALLDDTITTVREICVDLRPSVLDYAGLISALVGYSHQYTRRTGIEVRLQLPPAEERFGAEIESTLFRIVQEALTNIARHAEAGRVDLALSHDGRRTVLIVRDDGVGFDLSAQRRKGDVASRGLVAMRERAEFAGGVFDVIATPGHGTEIRVEFAARTDISDSPRHRFPGTSTGHTLQ